MKAGFLFTDRRAAHRMLEPKRNPRSWSRPRRRITVLIAAAVNRLLAK